MSRRTFRRSACVVALCLAAAPAAAENQGDPIPEHRQELKETLGAWRDAAPRLPLPKLSDDDRRAMGRFAKYRNMQMRYAYLPPELRLGDFSLEPDANMTLGYPFKTRLFWIVSRINHCQYCLGHQEEKLSESGLTDDAIGSLDGDWSELPPADQAAFAFARTLTFEPQRISRRDVEKLRGFFDQDQTLEIVLTVSNNNATNRWTGALAIPQDWFKGETRPTASTFAERRSQLAPLARAQFESAGQASPPGPRPRLESAAEVAAALEQARTRAPSLPLADDKAARSIAPDWPADQPTPAWIRALARFPKAGGARARSYRDAERVGDLPALLKAKIAWLAARHDRAWYALDQATRRLKALGVGDVEIERLAGPTDAWPEPERAALALAVKLTVAPAAINDADVAEVRKHWSDKQTAETIHHAANAAFFDRFTEALQLPVGD